MRHDRQVEVRELAVEEPPDWSPTDPEFAGVRLGQPTGEATEQPRHSSVALDVPMRRVGDVFHPHRDRRPAAIDGVDRGHAKSVRETVAQTAFVDPRLVQPVEILEYGIAEFLGDQVPLRGLGCRMQHLGDDRPVGVVGQPSAEPVQRSRRHILDDTDRGCHPRLDHSRTRTGRGESEECDVGGGRFDHVDNGKRR